MIRVLTFKQHYSTDRKRITDCRYMDETGAVFTARLPGWLDSQQLAIAIAITRKATEQ